MDAVIQLAGGVDVLFKAGVEGCDTERRPVRRWVGPVFVVPIASRHADRYRRTVAAAAALQTKAPPLL